MGFSFTVVVTDEQRAQALRRAARNTDVKIRLTSAQQRFLDQAKAAAGPLRRGA